MVTESWMVTNEKCRPEGGVELYHECWWEGLKLLAQGSIFVHQGSRNVSLQVSMSPSPSRRTGSVSPAQTIRRFSRTLKLALVLFTLAFCVCPFEAFGYSAPIQHKQRSRWTPSWSPGCVTPQTRARAGSVKAIGRVQRKQIFPCSVCSAGFFQLMPYKSLSGGRPARETYRLGNVHTINRSCSLKSITASVKNSLRHRRRIGLQSFQR